MRRLLAGMLLLSSCTQTSSTPPPVPDAAILVTSSDAGTPDAGRTLPENPSLDDLEDLWGDLVCSVWTCSRHTRITEETCERARTATGWPYDSLRRARASIEGGRGSLNQDRANACGALLLRIDPSLPCYGASTYTFDQRYGDEFRATCDALVTGTVAEGGTCDSTSECAGDGECRFDRNPECIGECVVWIRADQSCVDRPNDCGPDRFCNGMICRWKDLKENGEFCVDHSECKSGHCFDYACKDTSALNGECEQEGDCDEGLYCRPLPPSTGHLGICDQPQPAGGMCGYTYHCSGNQACEGYFWGYTTNWTAGTCRAMPGDVGDACTPIAPEKDSGDTGCFMDLRCNPSTSRCEEAPAIGSACVDGDCGLDAYCDAENVCRMKKGHNEPATSVEQCLNYFNQFDMKCEDPAIRDRCFMR